MIKAIIVDFFGIICSDEYWRFVKQDRQADSVFRDYTNEVNLGRIRWQAFVEKVAKATGKTVAAVNELYATEKINPVMVDYVAKLHEHYKTALLTNAHHEFIEEILTEGHLYRIFDVVVISSRLGIIKPDPKIFTYTLEHLNVKPAEAIYIDDLQRHVDAAQTLGIHAILYRNFKQMKRELEALLQNSNN